MLAVALFSSAHPAGDTETANVCYSGAAIFHGRSPELDQFIRGADAALVLLADREQYTLAFALGEQPRHVLATGETRYLSTEVAGGFTGVYFALNASGNGHPCEAPADFDWFEYRATQAHPST